LRAQLQAKLGLKRPRGAYPAAENSPLHTLRALRGAAPPPA
jgi:hypothetical protein